MLQSPSEDKISLVVGQIERGSAKRKEEQIKFIFNWAYKNLKDKLGAKASPPFDPSESERQFYIHYFGDVCARSQSNIAEYYLPTFNRKVKKSWQKSFNAAYLQKMRTSQLFVNDLTAVLDDELLTHQEKMIERKVAKFFFKWENRVHSFDEFSQVLVTAIESIKNCKKFKFPWSIREVTAAKDAVKKYLNELKNPLIG